MPSQRPHSRVCPSELYPSELYASMLEYGESSLLSTAKCSPSRYTTPGTYPTRHIQLPVSAGKVNSMTGQRVPAPSFRTSVLTQIWGEARLWMRARVSLALIMAQCKQMQIRDGALHTPISYLCLELAFVTKFSPASIKSPILRRHLLRSPKVSIEENKGFPESGHSLQRPSCASQNLSEQTKGDLQRAPLHNAVYNYEENGPV
jgi:hypothetical protein